MTSCVAQTGECHLSGAGNDLFMLQGDCVKWTCTVCLALSIIRQMHESEERLQLFLSFLQLTAICNWWLRKLAVMIEVI